MNLLTRLILLAILECGTGLFCLLNKKLPESYRFIGKLLLVLAGVTVAGIAVVLAGWLS